MHVYSISYCYLYTLKCVHSFLMWIKMVKFYKLEIVSRDGSNLDLLECSFCEYNEFITYLI